MKAARNVSQSKLGEAFQAPVPPSGLWGTTPRGPTLALSVPDTGALRQHFRGSASLSLIDVLGHWCLKPAVLGRS